MGTQNYWWAGFWLVAGFMAGIAAAFFLVSLWQRNPTLLAARQRKWLLPTVAALFVGVAVGLYAWLGQPQATLNTVATSAWPDNHAVTQTATSASTSLPGSIEAATAKLVNKLAVGQGSDADWQLLQQSYEFLGDSAAAALAQQHRLKRSITSNEIASNLNAATIANADHGIGAKLAPYQALISQNENDAAAWLAIAQLQRTARNYTAANDAYGHVITLAGMTANAWADYADVQASLTGSLTNSKTRSAVESALKIEPQHAKALWLKASIAHEEHRYRDALALWQRLLAVIPSDSADVKVIQANIEEARALASNTQATVVAGVATSAQSVAHISGRVELTAALQSKLTPDMTLFVYAKPNDASGMPAAVLRESVNSWPATFELNDSQAMLPTRKLSQFKTVTVQARLSRNGQALPQTGDLQTDSVTITTDASQPVVLRLTQVVK